MQKKLLTLPGALKAFLLVTLLAMITLTGCSNPGLTGDDTGTDNNATGTVRFSWADAGQAGSRSRATLQDAAKVVITIEAADGTVVYDQKQLNLFNFNGSFISEPLALKVGNYRLTDYLILDSTGTVIYAAPKAGSNQAHLVTAPLPLDFNVTKNGTTKIKPQVVNTETVNTQPSDYGYWTFKFTEVKIFNFLTSVMIYDASTDGFMPTDAMLDVTTDTNAYNFRLAAGTNSVAINDVTGNYTVTIKKAGYEPHVATYTNTEMKAFFQAPLTVVLKKKSGPLTFADANLESAIRTAINKPTGEITEADVAALNHVRVDNKPVSSLDGLDRMPNLTAINMTNCGITDISAIAALPNLEVVNFSYNNVTDISPLANLSKMRLVQMRDNPNLSDISSLTGKTTIISINMINCNISDISPITGLSELAEVGFDGNSITDLSPLAGKNKLQRAYLNSNNITDISPLANLPLLYSVKLDNNSSLSDISALATLPKLYEVFLRFTAVSDLTPLLNNAAYKDNKYLYIAGSPLTTDAQTVQIPALEARGVHVKF